MRHKKKSTKGLTELQETKELWNLGDGLENVCNSVKMIHADIMTLVQAVRGEGQ